jgi:hypothetical protein
MNKIIPIILLVVMTFVAYGVYKQANKSIKTKRIECQAKTTTFEKIFIEEPIKEAIKSLKTNSYTINSSIEYSKFMKSNLVNILTKEQADEKLEKIIKSYIADTNIQTNTDEKRLLIDYYIYENDKEDKGKKNNDAKSYAGYLLFEFKYDNKLVYKIQSDYMNLDGNDIEERMTCAIRSFTSLSK